RPHAARFRSPESRNLFEARRSHRLLPPPGRPRNRLVPRATSLQTLHGKTRPPPRRLAQPRREIEHLHRPSHRTPSVPDFLTPLFPKTLTRQIPFPQNRQLHFHAPILP